MGKKIVLAVLLLSLLLVACGGGGDSGISKEDLEKEKYFAKVDLLLDQFCTDGTDCSPGYYTQGAMIEPPDNCQSCETMWYVFMFWLDDNGYLD
jgi:hypothetical protein